MADIEILIEPNCLEQVNFSYNIVNVVETMKKSTDSQLLYLNCGDSHCSAVSTRGEIYQWGETDLGQLGFFVTSKVNPSSVTRSVNEELPYINRVHLGFSHTVSYSAQSNKLLVWGDNSKGQHGIDHFKYCSSVSDMSHLIKPGCQIAYIEAKANSTAIVLSDGSSLLWPCTTEGGGLSATPMYGAFGPKKIHSVSLGLDFAMYLLADGTVYSMGSSNKYGELGLGDTKPRFLPVKIKSLAEGGFW